MKIADLYALLGIRKDNKSFKKAETDVKRFADRTSKAMSKVGKALTSNLAGLVGVSALVIGARDAHAFRTSLLRLSIASKGSLGTLDQMQAKILEVSNATGIAKEEVLKGTASFISLTGDSETAAQSMGLFARVAQATGADIDDVARSGAALSQSMGIAGDDFEQAFSILIASGKAGSVELKDVSRVMAKLSAVSSNFAGGKGVDALAETGAALQLVTRAFGGKAKEGANALEQLMGSMVRAAPKLAKVGVGVFNVDPKTGKKTRKAFADIVTDINNSKLGLDPSKLIEVLGSKEALAAFEQLTKQPGEWESLTRATREATDTADDYAKASKNGAVKITKAWNKLKNTATKFFSKITVALAFVIDNTEAFEIAVASLGLAFLLLGRQAVAAGIKAAISWALAAAPFLLVAALIAIVFLLLEDLYQALTGGDSVIGDAWDSIVKSWGYAIDSFFNDLARSFRDAAKDARSFFSFIPGIDVPKTSLELDEERSRKARAAGPMSKAQRDSIKRSDSTIGDIVHAGGLLGASAFPGSNAGPSVKSSNATINASITINESAGGSDTAAQVEAGMARAIKAAQ